MKTLLRHAVFALAVAGLAVPALPAAAHDHGRSGNERSWQESRDHLDRYGYDTRFYGRDYHSQPDDRNDRAWRASDDRQYCRRNDGTTGLVVGAAAGALTGRSIDTRGDRTPGTLIGGLLGALFGRSVTQTTTCR